MYKTHALPRLWTLLVIVILLVAATGCRQGMAPIPKKPLLSGGEKMAVMGFMAALDEQDKPQTALDPLSGEVFSAEPVPSRVVREMTGMLFDGLASRERHELIPPSQAMGAYSSMAYGNADLALSTASLLQKVGKALGANLVLVGYIYRWRERQGTDYAVNRPASVAFDLDLVRSSDGSVVWNAKFDKTQKSLMENMLDLRTFLSGGGRWMTAKKLASVGLARMLDEMP
jgi:hypothetical protein